MKSFYVCVFLLSLFLFSFGQTEKATTFGTDISEFYQFGYPTQDGGFILGGIESYYMFFIANGIDYEKGLVTKIDSNGLVEWTYRLGKSDSYVDVFAVSQAQDGNYFVLGNSSSPYTNYPHFFLLKLDGNGSLLWQKSYITGAYSYANDICPTRDGGALIVGRTYRNQWIPYYAYRNSDEMLIFKIDGNGNIDWQGRYGQFQSNASDGASRAIQTEDGGFVVVGTTYYTGIYYYDEERQNHDDVLAMKLDSRGNILWQRSYGTTGYEGGVDVVDAGDGGFLIVSGQEYGYFISNKQRTQRPDDQRSWLFKINGSGGIVWQRYYSEGFVDVLFRATRLDTGGYLVAGATALGGAEGIQGRIMEIDDNGLVQWQKAYGGSDDDAVLNIRPINDRLLLGIGITNSFGSGWVDGMALVLSGDGNIASSCTNNGFLIQDLPDVSVASTVVGFESRLRRKDSAVEVRNMPVTLTAVTLDESLICERVKK